MHDLHRVTSDELVIGGPLPFTVFDGQGELLYGKGTVIGSIGVTLLMLARGLYRKREPARLAA